LLNLFDIFMIVFVLVEHHFVWGEFELRYFLIIFALYLNYTVVEPALLNLTF
jgi:hypothetical protein